MGIWEGTCGLTQTPIFEGDKIKLFILRPTSEYRVDRRCYSDDVYAPLLPPITGYYNCYGGIEDIENNKAKYWLERFYGDNLQGDLESTVNASPLFMVSEGVYTDAVKKVKGSGTFKSYLKQYKESCKVTSTYDFPVDMRQDMFRTKFYGCLPVHLYDNDFIDLLRESFLQDSASDLHDWIDFYKFKKLMELTRRLWQPQAGLGSQAIDLDLHWLVTKLTRTRLTKTGF